MFSRKWWGKTLDRMVRIGSYSLITLTGTDQVGWATLDWTFIIRTTAMLMALSFCGSIITTPIGPDDDDPSTV